MICSLKEDRSLKRAFWNINFGFTVGENYVDAIFNSLAVIIRVEDVANGITFIERVISNVALLLTRLVGKSYHKLTFRVSNERVVKVILDVRGVPDLGLLARRINLSDDLIKVRLLVHLSPERLTVSGIVATTIILLRPIVDKWDTSGCHGEDDSAGESDSVSISVEETSVVVIVYEDTKGIDVAEFTVFLIEALLDGGHTFTTLPDIFDCVVHGVIEQTSQVILIRTNIVRVSIETLTHLENSS